ncbi:MAG: sulfite exporter TauE/SafE family protein [Rhodobacteraceae bacterium]|nr:sulfite exporter TauE/SafE family protein [Paracoccaceae bacterium]
MPDMGLLILGAVLGGLVNGLSGFGFAIMALGVWLLFLPPTLAGPLVVASIIGSNVQALPRVWPQINLRHTAPFVLGGLVGVPIGVALLGVISVPLFKGFVAAVILVFLAIMLIFGKHIRLPAKAERFNPVIGIIGGIMSGLAGLAGVAPTIWATVLRWDKPTKRGIFQSYNLSMAVLSMLILFWAGYLTPEFWRLALVSVPVAAAAAWVGVQIYLRLGEAQFHGVVMAILSASGVSILVSLFL